LSRTVLDERLSRALTAFLRQEVQAPATAVTDLLDMIIEDARSSQPESMLADLNRMRGASVQLNAFVKDLIQDSSADRQKGETLEAFHRRLRHDRTLLNAIKGYSELLLEDMDTDATHPLRLDLTKLKESADQLLSQINAMTASTASAAALCPSASRRAERQRCTEHKEHRFSFFHDFLFCVKKCAPKRKRRAMKNGG
jgi:adenylate cyclase